MQHSILLSFVHATGFQSPGVQGFVAFTKFQTDIDRPCITVPTSHTCIDAESNPKRQAFCLFVSAMIFSSVSKQLSLRSCPSRGAVEQQVLTKSFALWKCSVDAVLG